MSLLGVNIDHVATLRQARGGVYPSPVEAALLCESSGADSIVAHLREDRRHIQDKDIEELKKKLTIPLNLEMSAHPSVVEVALKTKPDVITLVPERREERTTESGLDVASQIESIQKLHNEMKAQDINVSLFVDPEKNQIEAAKACDVEAIEIHTGAYANQPFHDSERELNRIKEAIEFARSLGIVTHVGHGLDYENVKPIAQIPGITEFNIGFSIISKSLFSGLKTSVQEMKSLIQPN